MRHLALSSQHNPHPPECYYVVTFTETVLNQHCFKAVVTPWLYNRCDSAGAKFTQQCGHHQKSVRSHTGNMNHSLAATLLCVVIPSLSVQSYFWNKLTMKQIFKTLPYIYAFRLWMSFMLVPLKDHVSFWHSQSLQLSACAFVIHFCNKRPFSILVRIYKLENHSLFQMQGYTLVIPFNVIQTHSQCIFDLHSSFLPI